MEVRHANGAVEGGSKVACGLHDGVVCAFAGAVESIVRAGACAAVSRLLFAELLSVCFNGLLTVRLIIASVVSRSRFVSVVDVAVFLFTPAPVLFSCSCSWLGDDCNAEAGRDFRCIDALRRSARLAVRECEGGAEDIAVASHVIVSGWRWRCCLS